MPKKNLIMLLAALCLVVSTFFTFSGATGQVEAATVKYSIVALAGPGGSISPSGIVLVSQGSSKTFTIKPNKGFHIANVLVDGVSAGRVLKYTFTNVTSPHRILALFASSLLINAGAGEGGSINPSGLVKVEPGASQVFEITPDPGYYIAMVIVDGNRVGPLAAFQFKKVVAAHSIIALFNKTFPILANASPGGEISPSGVEMVDAGSDRTYTITPDEGFHIVDVRVDQTWQGPVKTWNFTGVEAPHDIAALFSNQYPLVSRAGPGGTISPAGPMLVTAHSSQTYTITPKTGYYIFEVRVDGEKVSVVDNSYTFFDIIAPHLIVVTFTKTPPV